jgi:hypothetical protein
VAVATMDISVAAVSVRWYGPLIGINTYRGGDRSAPNLAMYGYDLRGSLLIVRGSTRVVGALCLNIRSSRDVGEGLSRSQR